MAECEARHILFPNITYKEMCYECDSSCRSRVRPDRPVIQFLPESQVGYEGAGLRTVKNYINGQWVEADAASYLDVANPSTGEVIARTLLSSKAEANRAIEAAAEAFKQ